LVLDPTCLTHHEGDDKGSAKAVQPPDQPLQELNAGLYTCEPLEVLLVLLIFAHVRIPTLSATTVFPESLDTIAYQNPPMTGKLVEICVPGAT